MTGETATLALLTAANVTRYRRNMAMHCLFLARKSWTDFSRLQPFLKNGRALVGLYSTAEKRSAGDDCHGDDPTDNSSHALDSVKCLSTRASKLEEQVSDLTERHKRALAESHNVRRRTQKFVEDAKLFGIQLFCRDLVEVADLLDEQSADPEEEGEEAQRLSRVREGLQRVFAKHGLEKMAAVGAKYDPYQHKIVCHTPAELPVEPGTITVVKLAGYKLHGRTIRHAHVGVAVKRQEH